MNKILIIACKEYRDAWREKLLVVLISCLSLMVILSVVIATLRIGVDVSIYNKALAQMKDSGQVTKLTFPQYSPLQMLRSSIEYLEIIGAVLAIILGHISIARERTSHTLKLVLSRHISRFQFISGKFLGNLAIISTLIVGFCLFAYLSVLIIAQVQPSFNEIVKLCIAGLLSIIYLVIFYCLSALFTISLKSMTNALIISLVFWIGFVLILPQIGDTMDVDNQVPGGFFASLNIPKTAEKSILTHFTSYETFRNTTEVISPTKHYERASFAILGIKSIYNGKSLSDIWRDKWGNIIVLISISAVMIALLYISFIKNKEIIT